MSRRRTIGVKRDTPVPPDLYLDVVPKMLWVSDTFSNEVIVMSNEGWLLE